MVTPSYFPIKGGAETVVGNLARELNSIGVHTDVLTFNMDTLWHARWKGKTEMIDNVMVFKIPALDWLPIMHSPRLNFGINLIPGRFRHLMKKYDILHFHQAEFSFPFFSYHVRKPKILHLHGLRLSYYERYRFSRFLLKTAADIYLSLSQQMTRDLTTLGIPKEKIVSYPNAVDTQVFRPEKDRLENTILYVGRITPDKGLDVLLRSLEYVKKPIRLLIAGPIDRHNDSNFYESVIGLMRNENSKSKHTIEYLGKVSKQTLMHLYQTATAFVLPSLYEPFAVVILEAMACGTPLIATSVGGVPEIVRSHENGILVPPSDRIRLAEAIDYLMENEAVRTRLGNAGRKLVEEKYDLRLNIRKLCSVYEQLFNS